MTVRELREALFKLENQDLEIHVEGIGLPIKEIEKVKASPDGNFESYYEIIIAKI